MGKSKAPSSLKKSLGSRKLKFKNFEVLASKKDCNDQVKNSAQDSVPVKKVKKGIVSIPKSKKTMTLEALEELKSCETLENDPKAIVQSIKQKILAMYAK